LAADPALLAASSAARKTFSRTALSFTTALAGSAAVVAGAFATHAVVATAGRALGAARVANATATAAAHVAGTTLFTGSATRSTEAAVTRQPVVGTGLVSAASLAGSAARGAQIT